MRKQAVVLACLGAGILLQPYSSRADTTNLFPVEDTALRSSAPDNNFGAVNPLPLGVSTFGTSRNRMLLKFDVSGIPANATITSATVRVTVVMDPNPAANFSLHRVLKDWTEGNKTGTTSFGAAATSGEATWNSRMHLIAPWAAGGGLSGTDFAATASATTNLSAGTKDFTSAELISDVQSWLENPGTNYGWILIATGEPNNTGKQIASREDSINRPVLVVGYSTPVAPPPQPPQIFDTAATGGEIRFSFNAQSNYTYTVESRDSLTTGSWTSLVEIPAEPFDRTVSITNTISPGERYFRVGAQ
jgi:hypothetical protein